MTDTVRLESIQPRSRVIGSLRARSTATVAALEEGVLIELPPREAEHVDEGAVVARTDTRRLDAERLEVEARIAEAQAQVAARRADLANRRRDLEANQAAASQNAVSQREVRNAQTAVDTGEAELRASEQMVEALDATRARLDVRLHDAEVRAPFAARVIARHAEPGEWVRPGDALLTLQTVGTIEAWLSVPERLADALVLDPKATHVELAAMTGTRSVERLRVLPKVDERARTITLIADLDDADGTLAPGMSVSAWVATGPPRDELLVPKDALVRRDRSVYVQCVIATDGGGEVVKAVPIAVRFELSRHVAIEPGGLSAGDRVVIEGNERLLPGAAVTAVPVDEPAAVASAGILLGD